MTGRTATFVKLWDKCDAGMMFIGLFDIILLESAEPPRRPLCMYPKKSTEGDQASEQNEHKDD